MRRTGIIMAGGSGERFWPLSRRNRPKQLLRLTDESDTMLHEAVSRLAPLIAPDDIYIVTGAHLVDAICKANIGVPDANVLAEPFKRNTGGCLCFAAAHLIAKYGGEPRDISVAVVTADHRINPPERFREAVELALDIAEQDERLVTHGIVPDRPETGYGYIQAADPKNPITSRNGLHVYGVKAFHEKPSRDKAIDFISSGDYFWNSGMFFWRLDVFLAELELARAPMADAVHTMVAAISGNDKGTVTRTFEDLENISIDYALMEHAKRVAVVRADYAWDDVGAWTSLDRTREHDAEGNIVHGQPVLMDCRDCIVFNDAGPEKMAVSVVGVEDLVVVVSEDGVLVIPKDRAQDVRLAVAELKARAARQV